MKALVAALAACALLAGTTSAAPKHHAHMPKRAIAIVLNGERLALNPPPRLVKRHLLVPVRRIIAALGLDFVRDGRDIVTHVGSKTAVLMLGSSRALVDGEAVALDAPTVEIHDTLYASLRFFTDVLGAQATFNRKAAIVTIVAQLIGRSGDGIVTDGRGVEQVGTVTAVDLNSDPPTVTLTYNASVRTVPIAANAIISLHDVNANVTVPGELSDVRPGDFAQLFGDRTGVTRLVDAFGSRVGTIAAAAGGEMVLNDGHVIVPDRLTRISIDGVPATASDVQVGDRVTVRYNVDSGEVREILVARPLSSPPPGALRIARVATDATRPLRAGDVLTVTLNGPAGGAATFDIGPYVTNMAMSESRPGIYTGTYTMPRGASFADVPVIGHLRVDGVDAAPLQADGTISASSSPPGISDLAPTQGSVVNSSRPAIFATFAEDAVGVNPSSVILWVNGRDVTSNSTRTERYIYYLPGISYPDGTLRVKVRLADYAGNVTTKLWSFRIKH